jgi:hypothetical protein
MTSRAGLAKSHAARLRVRESEVRAERSGVGGPVVVESAASGRVVVVSS